MRMNAQPFAGFLLFRNLCAESLALCFPVPVICRKRILVTHVLSKQVYDTVFKPIDAELPKDTTIIMCCLDCDLRYVPMSALWDGNRFLAERFNHVIFTRSDTERLTRNVNPTWTGTGFGTTQALTVELFGNEISFPALPGVTEELREVFKQPDSDIGILAGEVLPDAKLKQHRPVVHIASHFSLRPGDEARSFLLLGDGGRQNVNVWMSIMSV